MEEGTSVELPPWKQGIDGTFMEYRDGKPYREHIVKCNGAVRISRPLYAYMLTREDIAKALAK